MSGCGEKPYTYDLSAEGIIQIWVETLPPKSDSPKYTTDKEVINDIVSYVNGLKLRPRSEKDEDINGMSTRIEICYADGTKRVFVDFNPYFFETKEGQTNQYVMIGKQADTLNTKIYPKMESAPAASGMVEEVYEGEDNMLSLVISAFPDYQKIVGDKSMITVNAGQIYKDSASYTEVKAGDTVEFFIIGGVRETYPTQSDAYKVNVLATASDGDGAIGAK